MKKWEICGSRIIHLWLSSVAPGPNKNAWPIVVFKSVFGEWRNHTNNQDDGQCTARICGSAHKDYKTIKLKWEPQLGGQHMFWQWNRASLISCKCVSTQRWNSKYSTTTQAPAIRMEAVVKNWNQSQPVKCQPCLFFHFTVLWDAQNVIPLPTHPIIIFSMSPERMKL